MSKRDIESYTVNELGLMAVKQLKRIADAIEAQTAAVMAAQATRGPNVVEKPVKIDLTSLRAAAIPDENPDAGTDLGLSDEENGDIEDKIDSKLAQSRTSVPPRAMGRVPVKGKK